MRRGRGTRGGGNWGGGGYGPNFGPPPPFGPQFGPPPLFAPPHGGFHQFGNRGGPPGRGRGNFHNDFGPPRGGSWNNIRGRGGPARGPMSGNEFNNFECEAAVKPSNPLTLETIECQPCQIKLIGEEVSINNNKRF